MMKKTPLAIAAGIGLTCTALFAQEPPKQTPQEQYADALRLVHVWLDAHREYDRLAGLSAAVVVGQDVLFQRGYGTIDRAGKKPAGGDTIYSICSISKLLTSVAILQLADAGKLRLDDDVTTILPELKAMGGEPDSAPVTIRGMLTHSSGLPNEGGFTNWTGPDFRFGSGEEITAKLAGLRMHARASERYQYSNLGMSLLGRVVEKVSGTPYEQYVEKNILTPLSMTDTRAGMPMDLYGSRLAEGFGPIKRDGTRDPVRPFEVKGYMASAGYTSTPVDLAKFASWQFRLLKNGGKELLQAATLRDMQRVQWTDPDNRATMGLGYFVQYTGNVRSVSHSGACPGYYSGITLVPGDELAVIVMTNNQVSAADYTRPMRAMMEKGRRLARRAAAGPDLDAYSGLYNRRNRGAEQAFLPWGAGLATLELPTRDPAGSLRTLKHISGDTFRQLREDGTLGSEYVFIRDAGGKVIGNVNEFQVSDRMRALPD